MGRLLAIDYGRKRCGIAVTDPLRIVATALATVPSAQLIAFVKDYVSRETVDGIIVGLPTTMAGEPSESMRYITPAGSRLKKLYSGLKKSDRRDKGAIDRMAAVIILNGYLDSRDIQV